ncbi:MAG TPA: hypothetical protein O0X97_04715 [Methanocorpusculum sp.]|nr:hypothetical protein [Methanocorpusculum sp.]
MNNQPSVDEFFAKIRTAGFFARLFSWKKITAEAESAYQSIKNSAADTEAVLRESRIKEDTLSRLNEEKDRRIAEMQEQSAQNSRECAVLREKFAAEESKHILAKETAEKLAGEKQAKEEELIKVREELTIERTRLTAEIEMYNAVKTEAEELSKAKQESDAALADVREELSAEHIRLESKTKEHDAVKSAFDELAKEKQASDDALRTARERLSAAEEGLRIEQEKSAALKTEAESKASELAAANEQLAAEESVKEERAAEYERRVSSLNTLIDQMKEDHERAEERIKQQMEEHNELLASAWQRHEKEVEDTLKALAKRYDFIRCEKNDYPYSGTPDNVFLIGGMYTIFDAKSPKNPEDLENFPAYLKQQAEGMKKYCRNENVRKDAFLVVPSSAAEVLTTFVYPLADYTVYVITPDAVLPILQMLKTIEAYDFAEQMSPEDRDKLCRFIGKLSHTAKRKIQIDTYLSQEFVSVLRESAALPEEFAKDIEKYEKEAKLNPPIEKRAKLIAVEDIAADVSQVERDILGWARIEE